MLRATQHDVPQGVTEPSQAVPLVEPPAKRRGDELQRNRAWGRLPNVVALDQRVSPATLVLLAFRSTLANYSLDRKSHNRLVTGGGLGQRVVRTANAEAVGLGLLERHQPGGLPGSKFRYAVERLNFPEPGELGRRIVRRSWFNGTLPLRELAALLFLRAAGPVLVRELAARFGWGRRASLAVLRGLAARGLVVVHEARTVHGAFGPTFYRAVNRVQMDLGITTSAKAATPHHPRKTPGKLHGSTPPRRTPPRRNVPHVLTASQGVPSEQNLATLDSGQPARTSRSEALSDETPPPAAAPCSSGERKISPSASKAKITLSDWQAARFFREKGHFVSPDTRERVTDLAGWRAMVARHGGAPDHLLTPWAWRQAEHLAQHLAMQTTMVAIDALLDGIAYWVAEAAGRGVTIRSLALIGQPLYADLASGGGSRIFDRPSSLPQARYDEASLAAAEFAQALSNCNVDVPSLTSTLRIEHLADMLARYGREAVVQGINRTTEPWRDARKPGPEGRTVYGWRFFETGIQAVLAERNAPRPPLPPARPAHELFDERLRLRSDRIGACRKHVDKRVPAWVARLEAEGAGRIEVRREKLLDREARKQLAHTLAGLAIEPEQIDAVMNRFVDIAIAQRVTPLAGWRKGVVHLAANREAKGGDHA